MNMHDISRFGTEYRPPGTTVSIELEERNFDAQTTEFHTVIIGSGNTVRERTVVREDLKADTDDFPYINFNWEVNGEFNFQHFNSTSFEVEEVCVHRIGENGVEKITLEKDVDYEVQYAALARAYEGVIVTTLRVPEGSKIKKTDTIFDLKFKLEIDDDDIEIQMVNSGDKLFLRDIFGDLEIEEDGEEFFNDVGMAAEIAFKTGVQRFFYLEVPRDYGKPPTEKDFRKVLELIYHQRHAYRIVPLTDDPNVAHAVATLTATISNPYDRRESVAFISVDGNSIKDHSDLNELVEKVGGLSEGINSERVVNVYAGMSVELPVGAKRYILPHYFMNAAVAFADSVLGMEKPLSKRSIDVFSRVNAPKFRPQQWNQLAKRGVFIVFQERTGGPLIVRHQLTTKRGTTSREELVEYSITKNFDATVQLVRDRLTPYVGRENIGEGYFEKVDSAFTSAKEDAKELGYVRDITPITGWEIRRVSNGLNEREVKTNIVGTHRLTPVYPGNNIDVVFIV